MNRPELRIGDVEREAAVSALGEHYAAGRITKEEFDTRADVAWRARTRSDLVPLFADLPRLHEPRHLPASPQRAGARGAARGPRGRSRPPVIPVLLLVVVVAAALGLDVWPFVLLGVVYLWLRTWMGLASARRWFQEQSRQWRGTTVEPWRRPTLRG